MSPSRKHVRSVWPQRCATMALVVGLSGGVATAWAEGDPGDSTLEAPVVEPTPSPAASAVPAVPTLPPLPALAPLASQPGARVRYQDGLRLATPDDAFVVRLQGRVMPRWTLTSQADDVQQAFTLRSARLGVDGAIFTDHGFALGVEFADGTPTLADAFVDKPIGLVRLRFGQFKVPFAQQQAVALTALQFAERAVTDGFVGLARELGVSVRHQPATSASGLAWEVAVQNGPRDVSTGDAAPRLAARVAWHSRFAEAAHEPDLDAGPLRWVIGAAYAVDLADGASAAMRHDATLDVSAAAWGWAFTGAGFWRSLPSAGGLAREHEMSGHGQVGRMVVPGKLDLAVRYAQVPRGNRWQQEFVAALNFYRAELGVRWLIEGGVTRATGVDAVDWLVRVQTQLRF